MKRWIGIVAAAVLVAAGGAAWYYLEAGEPTPSYRLAKIERGAIVSTVSATGTVNAVTTVQVGSQLSGQIKELYADFNTKVKADQPLARLDTDTIEARLLQARADLDSARAAQVMQAAQVEKVRADLLNAEAALAVAQAQAQRAELLSQDAERENGRKQQLVRQGYTTQADADKAKTALDTARSDVIQTRAQIQAVSAQLAAMQASLRIAEAQVATAAAQAAQREAMLQQVRLDLDHATIRAPIDGVVVQRSVDLGQTVAASLQSPTLFNIAQDLRVMQVETSIDEGDIGRIAEGQHATFSVTAFPADTFEGRVSQIRLGPQIVQNVVTYVVVISAENPDMKLLPGMTATVRVVTDRRANALKAPNAALRFRPPGAPAQQPPGPPAGGGQRIGAGLENLAKTLTEELKLTPDQQRAVEDIVAETRAKFAELAQPEIGNSARVARGRFLRNEMSERIITLLTPEQRPQFAALRANRGAGGSGQIWLMDATGALRAVAVRLGIGDGTFTEIVRTGSVEEGQTVVVGTARPQSAAAPAAPPPRRLGF